VTETGGDGTGSPGPVDYDHIARRYQEGRALTDPALDVWWAAAARFLPATRPLTVLDLGAGTGIFARAWPRWCDCRVIAVEPSDGMRSEAVEAGMPSQVALMAGEGEAVGLRSSSVETARAAASWARRMRHADTLLGAFSDEDFRQGVAALDASASDQALVNRLTLLAFTNR
jgi:ubiquinone/menaquinone biosynthesis C-methylase UbiE